MTVESPITIDLTPQHANISTSPKGRPAVSVEWEGEEYFLYTTKHKPIALELAVLLREGAVFGVIFRTLMGPAINWRVSLDAGKVVPQSEQDTLGVYLPGEDFDTLITLMPGAGN